MINRVFFKKQILNACICIMITSLIVYDLKIIKHKNDEYIIILIYVYDKDNIIEKLIRTCFIKEIHIINDFKIKKFENISISLKNKTTHINNCKMIILLKIKIIEIIIDKSVYLRKTTIMLFKIELLIKVHYLAI